MKRKDKDMYLPFMVCGLGIFFMAAALGCLVMTFMSYLWLLGFVFCGAMGGAAILCWKNQWAEMTSGDTFIYSTMFGRETEYHFSEIRGLKQRSDSMTLILESGKVHVEECAVISERFAAALDAALEKAGIE